MENVLFDTVFSMFITLGLVVSILNLVVAIDPYGIHFRGPWSTIVQFLLVRFFIDRVCSVSLRSSTFTHRRVSPR